MTNMRTLKRRAEALGATVDDDGSRITVEAPEGKHFTYLNIHEVVHAYGEGSWGNSRSEAIVGAIDDLTEGFRKCDDESCPDCEWWVSEE